MILLSSYLIVFQNGPVIGVDLWSTITVDDSGDRDHRSIQEAIDAAYPGDLIHVYPGLYKENLIITKNITIYGEDPSETIIEALEARDVVTVHASNVTLSGLTICSEFNGFSGIDLGISNSCLIENCVVERNGQGISLHGVRNEIRNNTIEENVNGIVLGNIQYETLMMGNSYTGANSLHSLIGTLLKNDITKAAPSALTGGGMKISDHASRATQSGHQWNTTLNGGTSWKQVILQDQSQVPSFPTDEPLYNSSLNGAKTLNEMIENTGGDTIFLMTWGYRDGDPWNPALNPNYTIMQSNLENGYRGYAENCSTPERPVYIAPCGLAWKRIHDSIVEEGLDPTTPGNLFYDLYAPDGSHPALPGSYLAACVIYATITGRSPIGLSDPTILNSTYRQLLQEAAHSTVFNGTGEYGYPWQNDRGISFAEDNLIHGNGIYNNDIWGISIVDNDDSRNRIKQNDLVSNNDGYTQARDNGNGNQWDDGSVGNFWSDHTSRYPDATNDGIVWDTPYDLEGNAAGSDRYPLVDRMMEYDDIPPIADAGPDQIIDQGTTVILNASGSEDNVGIVNYTWNFFYNSTSISLNGKIADFHFEIPDNYSVFLIVMDAEENMGQDMVYIQVNERTIADTSPPIPPMDLDLNSSVMNGSLVELYAGMWIDPESGIGNFSWSFNYNGIDLLILGMNFSYLFDRMGSYHVLLNVTNGEGVSNYYQFRIEVFNDDIPPIAVAGKDVFIDQHHVILLSGSGSTDNMDAIVSYLWIVEDAMTFHYFGINASHVFREAGIYRVILNVTDIHGNWDLDIISITVNDTTQPFVEIGENNTIKQGETVSFEAEVQSDNVGIVTYNWTVHDVIVKSYENLTSHHRFDHMGTFTVTLTVRDAAGNEASDSISVFVQDGVSPIAIIEMDRTTVYQNETLYLDGNNCTDNVGIVNWTWTINDTFLYSVSIEFIFIKPGSFEVVLEVFDEAGNSAKTSIWIEVKANHTTTDTSDGSNQGPDDPKVPIIITVIIPIVIVAVCILVFFISSKRSSDDRSNAQERNEE